MLQSVSGREREPQAIIAILPSFIRQIIFFSFLSKKEKVKLGFLTIFRARTSEEMKFNIACFHVRKSRNEKIKKKCSIPKLNFHSHQSKAKNAPSLL